MTRRIKEPLMTLCFGNFDRPAFDDRAFIDQSVRNIRDMALTAFSRTARRGRISACALRATRPVRSRAAGVHDGGDRVAGNPRPSYTYAGQEYGQTILRSRHVFGPYEMDKPDGWLRLGNGTNLPDEVLSDPDLPACPWPEEPACDGFLRVAAAPVLTDAG